METGVSHALPDRRTAAEEHRASPRSLPAPLFRRKPPVRIRSGSINGRFSEGFSGFFGFHPDCRHDPPPQSVQRDGRAEEPFLSLLSDG